MMGKNKPETCWDFDKQEIKSTVTWHLVGIYSQLDSPLFKQEQNRINFNTAGNMSEVSVIMWKRRARNVHIILHRTHV
jgi:hypothetical protein